MTQSIIRPTPTPVTTQRQPRTQARPPAKKPAAPPIDVHEAIARSKQAAKQVSQGSEPATAPQQSTPPPAQGVTQAFLDRYVKNHVVPHAARRW